MSLTRSAPQLSSPTTALERDGRIDWIAHSLRGIDAMLRQWMGIEEFCRDHACILRLARRAAERDIHLADGTWIRRGDPIGELHLWNEHLPRVSETGSGLAWALEIRRRFEFSFAQLARHLERDPRFAAVAGVRGAMSFARRIGRDAKLKRVMNWHGIEIIDRPPGRFAMPREIGYGLFTLGLIHAFDLGGRGVCRLRRQRLELWLSRRTLRTRHGGAQHAGAGRGDDRAPRKSAA